MKAFRTMILLLGTAAALSACQTSVRKAPTDFKYTIDSFADLKVMRYQVPGWENLTLRQKE